MRSSTEVVEGTLVGPYVGEGQSADERYQFERVGYFWRDSVDSSPDRLVFNRIVTLRDTWARRQEATKGATKAGAAGNRARRDEAKEGKREREAATEREAAGAEGPGGPGARRTEVAPEVRERADALGREFGLGAIDAETLARDAEVDAFYRKALAALRRNTAGAFPDE